MKKHFLAAITCLILFSITACNGKTSALVENASANGKVKIKITAKRNGALEPFKVDMAVTAYDFKQGKLLFEIAADDLNQENVKFNWTDDNTCTISITERDNHVRNFQLLASENQVQLAEI
jgi:hypothetical protein